MTSYGERMAKIEEKLENTCNQVVEIKDTLSKIDGKLDSVIEMKADKSDVDKLDNRFWAAMATALVALISTVVSFLLNK